MKKALTIFTLCILYSLQGISQCDIANADVTTTFDAPLTCWSLSPGVGINTQSQLYMNPSQGVKLAILPRVYNGSGTLSFDVSGLGGKYQVGMISSPSNSGSFIELGSGTTGGSKTFDFSTYQGEYQYVAIIVTNNYLANPLILIDNLSYVSGCPNTDFPVFNINDNLTIQLDASGNASLTAQDIDNGSVTTCGNALSSVSLDVTSFTCADLGSNTVTLTANYNGGSIGTTTATVNVVDNIFPTATGQDITVQVDANTGYVNISSSMIDSGSTDNCGAGSLTMSLSKTQFRCEDTGDNTVTLSVEDASGNVSTTDVTVTVTSSVVDETVTATNTIFCPDGSQGATISTGSSLVGYNYTLRDSEDNSVVAGPIAGTGSGLDFQTGNLSATKTFNILLEKVRSTTQSGLDFDGVNDYVSLGTDNRGISTAVTIGAWIKTSASGSTQFITAKYNGTFGYYLYLDGNGYAQIAGRDTSPGSAKQSGFASKPVNDNEWHYIVGSINISTGVWSIYVDGVLENSTTYSAGTTLACTNDLTIGSYSTTYSTAIMDQLTIWDTELDASTIQTYYNSCLVGNESNIVGHFIFEDGSGTTLTDQSASSLDGTLTNMDGNTDWVQVISPSCGEKLCDFQMTTEITVGDNTAPTVVTQDISVQLDANSQTTVTAAMIDDGSSDNCSGTLTMSLSKTDFTCSDTGVNTVTLTVEDESGNQATGTATVTITSPITDESVTATDTEFCSSGNSTTITTGSSSSDALYYLRNSANDEVLDGPIQGNGSSLSFNTGVINATTTYNVYAEIPNTFALDFDGVDDNVNFGTDHRNITTAVTIGAWIKTTSAGSLRAIVYKYSTYGFLLYMDANGKLNLDSKATPVGGGTQRYVQSGPSTTSINDGQWHYVVGSIDMNIGIWKVYVDGVLESTGTDYPAISLANSSDLLIGSYPSSNYFEGQIDQVTLWNSVLSEATINTYMGSCLTGSESSVVGHFKMDEGSGSTITDLSSSAANGTMTNMDAATDWVRIDGPTCSESACGVEMSTEVTVSLQDLVDPIAAAQDFTVQLDASGNATITANDINDGSYDGCTADNDLVLSLSKSSFSCADIGANAVTLTVEDLGGNTATASATVTVVEGVAPTALAQDITVALDAAGNASITAADINNSSSDNCTASGALILSLDQTAFTCADLGENTVTLTVEDASGNQSMATATVTIEDVTAPTAVAQSITIYLDATGNATVSAAAVNNGSSDACTAANSLIASLDKTSFTCADLGANAVTLTISDASGNQDTAPATITVSDEVAPSVVTQDISVQLDASGNVSITAADVNNGSFDNCTASGSLVLSLDQTDFTCADVGSNTVTLMVEDASGNIGSLTANVVVEDVTPPVATSTNLTVYLDASGMASVDPNSIDNGSSDLCSNNLTFDLSKTTFSCSDIGANSVTFTATDESGNSSIAASTITVVDNVAPVAITKDITVRLDINNSAVIAASDVDDSSSDNCSLILSLDTDTFDETNLGANTVTLTVEDMSGNSSTATATVTIAEYKQDQTISFNSIADKTYGDQAFSLSATASSGLSVTYAVISGPASISGSSLNITGIGTVTVEATQAGNNDYYSTTAQQTFSVQKATLSVIADNQSIVYGNAIPTLTFQYSGFVNGETSSVLTSEPVISTTATNTSDTGTYAINLTGGAADNYTIVNTDGELTINKANQSISLEAINDMEPTDSPFDVVASASSGLDVTYEVSGPATISGSTITLDGTNGNVTVTVSQSGNANYNAAESKFISFEVREVLAVGDELKNSVKIYPNPVTEFVVIETEKPVSLNFFSLKGELVKSLDNVRGQIQLSDLRTGYYVMEIVSENERLVRKILKTN